MSAPSKPSTTVIEVRYLSMSKTHIQVEYAGLFGMIDEYWIALDQIHNEFNIFHDIMDLEVSDAELQKVGIDV